MARGTKGGRPTKYSEDLAAEICARISEGLSLRTICRDEAMPDTSTVFRWLGRDPAFQRQYMIARASAVDAMGEDLMDIADDGTNDWMEVRDDDGNVTGWKVNGEHIQRSKLRVDARKWMMSKLAPKRYGDRQQLEHTGADSGPIVLWGSEGVTDRDRAKAMAALMLNAQNGKGEDDAA